MSELDFEVLGWLAPAFGTEAEQATSGSLRISAGHATVVALTEVEDSLARTVRDHVNLPLVSLAEWLLGNWWRLRWEGRPPRPSRGWQRAHSLAAIGGGNTWPNLEISSDGAFVELVQRAEDARDVSAVRYLRSIHVEIPAMEFEAAVNRLVDVVEARLVATLPAYRSLRELREELAEETSREGLARECRWQALAGMAPGDAEASWLERARALVEEAGGGAGDEILGVVSQLKGGLTAAARVVEALKASTTTVDSTWVPRGARQPRELPWQTGARWARELRTRHGLGNGPLPNQRLSELLSVPIPLQGIPMQQDRALGGGYRNGVSNGRTRVGLPSQIQVQQRFFLARMIAGAASLDASEHVIPVTKGDSALQKIERSFAQELLCPWEALDAFTDEQGVDADGILEAAEHFQVSEYVVRTTLVNRGKMSRDQLPAGSV